MIVMITGASAGFGAAMARKFVSHGHQVIAAARRKDRLDQLAGELGKSLFAVELDVTSKTSIDHMMATLPSAWQNIDVLVNNAGLALGLEPAHQAHLEDWDTMIATNCQGLVTMTRAVLPGMVDRGRGLVINLGSVAGAYPYPGGNVYEPPILHLACRGAPNFPTCALKAMTHLPPRFIKARNHSQPMMLLKLLTGLRPYQRM